MENKENLTKKVTDELNNIADYYKNTEESTPNTDDTPPRRTIISDSDPYANEGYTPFIPKRRYNGNLIAEIAFIAACMIVALAIVMLAFYLGSLGIKDSKLVEDKYFELIENDSRYNDTIRKISDINTEIEELTRIRDLKQAEYDALIAYRDGAGSVEDQIFELQTQLDELDSQNLQKQAEISALTSDISEMVATIMNLPPGIYTVGESIAAGKYNVTGSGSILVSGSGGNVKLNTILTADGVLVTLDDLDKIQLDTRAKFSPAA